MKEFSSHSQAVVISANVKEAYYWQDLWRYRELFMFLAWRDILVRYKQTYIGIAWSILRPVITMIIFTVIFGRIAGLKTGGAPYPVFVFAALLPWQLFTDSVLESSGSLVSNAAMISKVYFPRLIIPTSSIIVSLVDFTINLILMCLLMVIFHVIPTWKLVFTPIFLLLACSFSLGIGILFASLNTRYRDFRYIVPFMVQFGLYISPIGFSSSLVPSDWRIAYYLNPMASVIDGFRWCFLGSTVSLYPLGQLVSWLVSLSLLSFSLSHFRRTERTFADVI